LEDGTLVDPGTPDTLKYDYVASKWTLAKTITNMDDSSRYCLFRDMQDGGLSVPQILKELAVFPADGSGYGGEYFYLNNGATVSRFPARGGYWTSTSAAGVFNSHLNNPRAYTGTAVGCRSAFYGE
jgi:hypothetical protein